MLSKDAKYGLAMAVVLVTLFGVLFTLGIHESRKIDVERQRCEAVGGVYLDLRDADNLCLSGVTVIDLR